MKHILSAAMFLVPAVVMAAPPVTAVAYHPDGKTVAFGLPGEVRVFSATDGALGDQIKVSGRVTALAFDPRGRWLAIASGEAGKTGLVSFVAVRGNRLEPGKGEPLSAHRDAVYTLAFSPDGKTLATAGYDRVIHLWDVPEGEGAAKEEKQEKGPRLTLKDHSDAVYALAFHPDGKLLASGSADRAVKVWDAVSGKRLYTLADATDWVYAVAWSPDKLHLAAAGVDKSVRAWKADAEGGKLVTTAFAHEKPVWRLAYTSDGKTLYTVGEDRIIKHWDALKLVEVKTFDAHPDAILDFAMRPDGKLFAVARFDGVGAILDPATGKLVAQVLPAEEPAVNPVLAQKEKPQPPKADKLTPNGGARGKTTRVVVTGTNLTAVTKVTASSPDVKAKVDPRGQTAAKLEVDVEIGPNAPVGVVQLTFESEGGKSTPIAFAVDRFPAVPEAGATDSARTAMAVKLPVTVVGTIDRPGDTDYFRFEAFAGDQIGVQVVAPELGSKLEPALVLIDEAGVVVAEGAAVLGYIVRKRGTYAVSMRDREFRGGPDFGYRLHIGPVPVVTGVFPLAAQRGRTTSVHVTGVNLGSPAGITAKVTVPAGAAVGTKVPVPLGSVQAVGAPAVVVAEFPSVVAEPVGGADLRVPGSADGILTKPNETQVARFNAKKGERVIVEVLAQRAGSPLDPVIEILDAAGKPVPLVTLRCTAKTNVIFRDHDSRSPGIRLEAWNELAIDDYLYVNGDLMRILALPKGPDDDAQFYQIGGQRLGFHGTTPTHHSLGEPMYKVEFHPPGTKFAPNGLPVFTLYHRNDDGGPGLGKDSRLFFTAPADGGYQVRVSDTRGASGPNHSYRVTVRPPKPDFTVGFSPTTPAVWKGGALPVTVTVNRIDGFDGPVRVKLDELPPGFHAPEAIVEGDFTTTTFALFASDSARVPDGTKLKLIARAEIGGKEVIREAIGGAPSVVPPDELVTTVRQQTITIQPGKETRFTVDIARQGKFTGRVPIEVKGLPHGVRVLNIGLNGILITERETSREVVLYAEPWVKPMEVPLVVLAKREGRNTEHAAKSLVLKVEK